MQLHAPTALVKPLPPLPAARIPYQHPQSARAPGPSRHAAQVTGPSVKATPGLVQLLADTLASGTGLPPSAVTPGRALNNSRCFDSPPPITNAGRRLHTAFPGLYSPGQLAQAALEGVQGETAGAGGVGARHSLRRLQQGCLTTVLVELDIDATSQLEQDYRNQARLVGGRVPWCCGPNHLISSCVDTKTSYMLPQHSALLRCC